MKFKITSLLIIISILTGCTGGLVVGGAVTGVATAHDRRSIGTVIDDNTLEWDISHALYNDAELDEASHINVTVYNNTILLSGEVASEDLKLRANAIASKLTANKQLFNELIISPPSSLLHRSKDAYITAKAKTALLDIELPNFDITRVKVTTEAGIVFLMGLVTQAEAEASTERIRKVSDVKKVVRLFEYTDQPNTTN